MKRERITATTVDEYIAGYPPEVQQLLQQVRTTIREAAPGADEGIGYRIAAYKLNGSPLIYFAGFEKHIGLYPVPVGNPELEADLAGYAAGKGTARFPIGKPIPFDLIRRLVKFRMEDVLARAAAKRAKRK